MRAETLRFFKWIGAVSGFGLIVLIVAHAGPWSLLWSIPLTLLHEFGCYADRDLRHAQQAQGQGGEG